MTENQRDYLADLAGKKGVVLHDTDNVSAAWASAKIDELKAMPDVTFEDVTPDLIVTLDKKTDNILKEMALWNFQE